MIYAASPMVFLFLLFIVLPLAELYVIIQVGGAIGIWPTLALLLLSGLIGASLALSQGRIAWLRFNEALSQGRVPAREVFDGGMVILGGALLLTPGFITDFVGIALLLPPGRALIRAIIRRSAARTPTGQPVFYVYDRFGSPGPGGGGRRSGGDGSGNRRGGAEGSGNRRGGGSGQGASPPPGGSPWDTPTRRRSQSYDVEGSARELGDEQFELPPGGDDD